MSWLMPTEDVAVFTPFKDYLGLLNLLGPASPATTTRSWPDPEDGEDDFFSNGRDGGLMPFPPIGEISWGESGGPLRAASTPSSRGRTCAYPRRQPTWCVFCRNNGESEGIYASHVLKDGKGKTTCPILRAYACPICGEKGDRSHTIKYCPARVTQELPAPLKTARTSTGLRRPPHQATSRALAVQSTVGAVGEGQPGTWKFGRHLTTGDMTAVSSVYANFED